MKKLFVIFSTVLLTVAFISSCTKLVPATSSTNMMSAVVGGYNDSSVFTSVGGSVSAAKNGSILTISGIAAQNVKITLYVYNFSGYDGSTTIDGVMGTATLDSGSGPVTIGSLTTLSGLINFTSTFPYLTGTFNFLCADSVKVTHGKFNCVAPK